MENLICKKSDERLKVFEQLSLAIELKNKRGDEG